MRAARARPAVASTSKDSAGEVLEGSGDVGVVMLARRPGKWSARMSVRQAAARCVRWAEKKETVKVEIGVDCAIQSMKMTISNEFNICGSG